LRNLGFDVAASTRALFLLLPERLFLPSKARQRGLGIRAECLLSFAVGDELRHVQGEFGKPILGPLLLTV
jgi:hypothetical protein